MISLVPPCLAVLTSGTLSQAVTDLVESRCAEIREQLNAESMSRNSERTAETEELMRCKRQLHQLHEDKTRVNEELQATKAQLERTELICRELETFLIETSNEIAKKLRK